MLDLGRIRPGPKHPLVILYLATLLACTVSKARHQDHSNRPLDSATCSNDASLAKPLRFIDEFADIVRTRDVVEAKQMNRETLKYAEERPEANAGNIKAIEAKLVELGKQPAPK